MDSEMPMANHETIRRFLSVFNSQMIVKQTNKQTIRRFLSVFNSLMIVKQTKQKIWRM